jgi:5-methyltetrahydrofolate--homocysteine methyltransferase
MNHPLLSNLSESVFAGDLGETIENTRIALQAGYEPMVIIEKGLIPGMDKLGEEYQKGQAYLPELLVGAEAMKSSLAIVKPLLKPEEITSKGTVVIGTVLGDVHDIGKNIVTWMLQGAGFNVIDLGVDVAPGQFIQAIKTETPHILALSALLTTSSPQIEKVIKQVTEHGLREKIKVMIGGASINQEFAKRVGADGYASDAVGAVAKAKEFMSNYSLGGQQ